MTLVHTINDYPDVAGSPSLAPAAAVALSDVLAAGAALPAALLTAVSNALSRLLQGTQANMAIGQTPIDVTAANARTRTSLLDPQDLAGSSFAAPQSGVEAFDNKPVSAIVDIDPSAGIQDLEGVGAVGLTVVQYTNNPSNATSEAKAIGVQLTVYNDSSSSQDGSSSRSLILPLLTPPNPTPLPLI